MDFVHVYLAMCNIRQNSLKTLRNIPNATAAHILNGTTKGIIERQCNNKYIVCTASYAHAFPFIQNCGQ